MDTVIFEGKNKNEIIEISFEKSDYIFLFQPILKSSTKKVHKIPLLLDLSDVLSTCQKLSDLKKRNKEPYDFDLLALIVSGAAELSIKGAF